MVLVVLISVKSLVNLVLPLLEVNNTTSRLSSEVYGSNDGNYALFRSFPLQ
jgi:hypothetical protein